jgi:hypothetical protein
VSRKAPLSPSGLTLRTGAAQAAAPVKISCQRQDLSCCLSNTDRRRGSSIPRPGEDHGATAPVHCTSLTCVAGSKRRASGPAASRENPGSGRLPSPNQEASNPVGSRSNTPLRSGGGRVHVSSVLLRTAGGYPVRPPVSAEEVFMFERGWLGRLDRWIDRIAWPWLMIAVVVMLVVQALR